MERLLEHYKSYFIQEKLTNWEIEVFLQENMGEQNYFLGVYAANTIPWKSCVLKKHWSIIVNLDPENLPGSHFVTIAKSRTHLFYFDSLKVPQMSRFFETFKDIARNQRLTFWTCPIAIQNVFSKFCGFYCIWFVLLMSFKKDVTSPALSTYVKKKFKDNDTQATNETNCVNDIMELISKIKIAKQVIFIQKLLHI